MHHILGNGSHARVLRSILVDAGTLGVALHDLDKNGEDIPAECPFYLGVGNIPKIGDSGLRRREGFYSNFMWRIRSLISPSAHLYNQFDGIQVLPRAIINVGSRFGANCLVNTGAIVEHDCVIGRSCHIAPGAILCGGVQIGSYTHVGAGSVIKQGIKIGDDCVVGIGSVVQKDLPNGATILSDGRIILKGETLG